MKPSELLLLCQLALSYQAKTGEEAIQFWDNFWEFIFPWIVPEPWQEKKYPEDFGPDICYRCLSYFGETISGRIRDGCPKCNGAWSDIDRSSTDRFYYHIQQKLGYGIGELMMARALFIHTKETTAKNNADKERKRSLIKWA